MLAPTLLQPKAQVWVLGSLITRRAEALLRHPERVEVFRVATPGFAPADPGSWETDWTGRPSYRLSQRCEADRGLAEELALLLLEETPIPTGIRGCIFAPAWSFRFHKGREAVEVLIGDQCEDVALATRDVRGRVIVSSTFALESGGAIARRYRELVARACP